MAPQALRRLLFVDVMQLATVFFLLISSSSGGPVLKPTTPRTVQCELVQLSECSKSCESGFMLMKYVCVEEVKVCECPWVLMKQSLLLQVHSHISELIPFIISATTGHASRRMPLFLTFSTTPKINKKRLVTTSITRTTAKRPLLLRPRRPRNRRSSKLLGREWSG